ncbi:MAG: glycoside hydrolase family 5 protein [Polyangiaceae bacterium]
MARHTMLLLLAAAASIAASCGSGAKSTGGDSGTGLDTGTTTSGDGGAMSGNDAGTGPPADDASSGTDGNAPGTDGASPTSDASAAPVGLHAVMGTGGRAGQILDKSGHVVVLHGADESGTENFCTTWGPPAIVISPMGGPSPLTQDSLTAMKQWGLNAVRIPLNEDCWLGINGVASAVGGANYQSPIAAAVNLITQTNGMYVILDLHWSAPGTTLPTAQGAMPDLDHTVTFWQQVATAYKDNGSVIFDLFNEPVMSSGTQTQQFTCWKNGSTTANGGDCPMVNFAVAGMQELLTTVRQAGATNLVMLGGTGYSSVLGPWPTYVPTDTLSPPNIAASWHVYDDQGGCTDVGSSTVSTLCTSGNLGGEAVMNAGYPIVVGETGYYSCSASVGKAWWPLFLSWADSQGLGYLAWSWSDSNSPFLLANTTTFTPGGIGPTYQSYLQCIATKTVTPATSCTFVPTTGCE